MKNTPAELEKASAAIQEARTILVATHINPDGDAIGSALGLANALKQMGKQVTTACDDGVPDYLQFLPGSDSVVTSLESGTWDVLISTDASDEERTGVTGIYGRANSQQVINIDHHVTNTYFGDIFLVVPTAVSATEIVYDWWQSIGIDWNRNVALPLLTGLVTDTLGFRTSNVISRTLEIAQELMRYGASLAEVTARTLENKTWEEISLWKRVLPGVVLRDGVIEATITQVDVEAAGLDDMHDTGLVGFLIKVDAARVAVIFKQDGDNVTTISMRAKPGYDVATVAFALGGGGHTQAAGATIPGTLAEVRAKVLPMLQQAVAKGTLQIG